MRLVSGCIIRSRKPRRASSSPRSILLRYYSKMMHPRFEWIDAIWPTREPIVDDVPLLRPPPLLRREIQMFRLEGHFCNLIRGPGKRTNHPEQECPEEFV